MMTRAMMAVLMLALLAPFPAYGKCPEDAQKELSALNIPYTADEFVKSSREGNATAVKLFLAAGMDPDVKNRNGATALEAAKEESHAEIMKYLLDKGAAIEPLLPTQREKEEFIRSSESSAWVAGGEGAQCFQTAPYRPTKGVEILPADLYKDIKVEQQQRFGGVGMVISLDENKTPTVISLIQDAPAIKAGVREGDKIIEIDGGEIKELPLEKIVKKIRGPTGSEVVITVYRQSDLTPFNELEFTLARHDIRIPNVKWEMLEDDTGVIHIQEFGRGTAVEFREAIKELKKEGMRSLVLDLRYNPGGLLDAAADVVDEFLEEGRLIAYTESRYVLQNLRYEAKRGASVPDIPVVILTGRGSAGASEMVVGALRQWNRAAILGEQTFGVADVRNVIPLSDGSALRLTTAKLFPPNGKSIDGIGISPDMKVPYRLYVWMNKNRQQSTDIQVRRAAEFLAGYDTSKTLEQNIEQAKKNIERDVDEEFRQSLEETTVPHETQDYGLTEVHPLIEMMSPTDDEAPQPTEKRDTE